MSEDVVERAKAVLEGTTPGPWEADLDPHGETRGIWPTGPGEQIVIGAYVANDGFDSNCWADGSDEDLRFIAQARTLVPELVAEAERLREGYAAAIHDLAFWAGCIHNNESIQESMHSAAHAHRTRLESDR